MSLRCSFEVLLDGFFQDVLIRSSLGRTQRTEPNVGFRIELDRKGNGFGLGGVAGCGSTGTWQGRSGCPFGSHLSVFSFEPKVYA